MKLPHQFYSPLAVGAPTPYRTLPVRPERVVHFFPPHVASVRARIGTLAPGVDVFCGNLEDGIAVEDKEAARHALIEVACNTELAGAALWVRVNALGSPWFLDDVAELVATAGNRVDVIMLPKVEGEWDVHCIDQYLAQLEARHRLARPILVHALIETAQGMTNVERIAAASPRLHGMSLGPADLAASRGMKTTRIGGGHPSYGVLSDPGEGDAPRSFVQQDLWHYSLSRMVDACRACGIRPFYGPFGDLSDDAGCEAQFRSAYLLGCVGAWSLSPRQIPIARRVFSPDAADVRAARRILEALPDGSGVATVDGRMQDDATWKQAKVLVDLARLVATRDSDLRDAYGF